MLLYFAFTTDKLVGTAIAYHISVIKLTINCSGTVYYQKYKEEGSSYV